MKCKIVGVLNITPDSFYDGGTYSNTIDDAIGHALKLVHHGADWLDIGGESTRPQSRPVSIEEEIKRVIPVISKLKKETTIPISIDTYKSAVAKSAIEAGAMMVNDVSGFTMDPQMPEVIASHPVKVVLGHIQGTPKNMQSNPHYDDVVQDVSIFFKKQISLAKQYDIKSDQIILDPGIGFGKTLAHNVEILRSLDQFHDLGFPLMIGTSRKSFIGQIHPDQGPQDRLAGSLATVVWAYLKNVTYFRVHDVKETKQALEVVQALG